MMGPGRELKPALWLVLAAAACGCLPLPDPGPAPTVGPSPPDRKIPHVEAAATSAAVPDTVRRDPVVRPWPMVFGPVEATPIPRTAQQSTQDRNRVPTDSGVAGASPGAPDPSSAAITDSLGAHVAREPQSVPPEVAVDLPQSARLRLERTALQDIALADSLTRRSALRALPNNQRDQLETSLGLIEQAREALVRGDVPGAANLAFKARLIAEEVAGRR